MQFGERRRNSGENPCQELREGSGRFRTIGDHDFRQHWAKAARTRGDATRLPVADSVSGKLLSCAMSQRNYIGLSCSLHDPALAIVDAHGELLFAEEAERALQTKRAYNNPPAELSRAAELLEQYSEPDSDLVLASTWSRQYTRTMAGVWGAIGLYDGVRQLFSRNPADGSPAPGTTAYPPHFERFVSWLCAVQVSSNSVATSNIAMAVQSRRVKRLFERPTRRTHASA